MSRPIVAIVGRPNVGKSALFNRLVGRPLAIVEDLPGTTRDRMFADLSFQGRDLTVVDTGGFEARPASSLAEKVQSQLDMAMAEADGIILAVDIQEGLMPGDQEMAERLRRHGKPVVVAANKSDHPRHDSLAAEFYRLGMGEPVAVSAFHDRGITDLMERVSSNLPPTEVSAPEILADIKIAIAGRPNVGKSLLLNSFLGTQRAIVDEQPGTTRDAVDTVLVYGDRRLLLIDTAGLRKRGRIEPGVEKYSALRSIRAIARSDVVLLVIDATEPDTIQDWHIAGYIQQALKGMVVVVNKWDLAQGVDRLELTQGLQRRLRFMPGTPVLFTSALLGQRVGEVLPQVITVYEERNKRVPDQVLDAYIKEAVASHNLPRSGKKEFALFKVSQVGVNPPTFLFVVNDARMVNFSYRRFLVNRLRELFGFAGTPLRFIFQDRGE
ncbi:MAG: ribosome biogenesis GTPase Der [Dehalococcoidia bacterium]|nr:ribosome biogenesis GTPase Der [Dehalococcoidia bacterium]